MSLIPCAWLELLVRYFGTTVPDYSATLLVAARDPYRQLRDRLVDASLLFEDLTDFNYDLGPVLWVTSGSQKLCIRLSFVGPFAIILDELGRPTSDGALQEILGLEGFLVPTPDQLEMVVECWGAEHAATLFEYIFQFDSGVPWK
jgi:hypothetical protein